MTTKQLRDWACIARAKGWRVVNGKKHVLWLGPDGTLRAVTSHQVRHRDARLIEKLLK